MSLPDSYCDGVTIALFLPSELRTTELWLSELSLALPNEEVRLAEEISVLDSVDIALIRGVSPSDLRGFVSLGFVQCLWAGVERLLVDPHVPAHLPLARLVDPAMADDMAATAVAHVLDIHRHHDEYRSQQRERRWEPQQPERANEKTIAVLGLGKLGHRTAELLRAFGFNVVGWRTTRAPAPSAPDGILTTSVLAEAVCTAHIVINLLPLTAATTGLLNHAFFSSLQPGTALINLARGAHVVDRDLLRAIEAGQISRAILDVFAVEPLPSDHPYWSHPQVTITPHVAAETNPRSAAQVIAANVRAWRNGEPIPGLVERTRAY